MADRPDDLTLARLTLVRQRRLGASFDEAWEVALAAIPPSTVGHNRSRADLEREAIRAALDATREDWRLAYERRPPRERPGSESANRRRLAQMYAVAA